MHKQPARKANRPRTAAAIKIRALAAIKAEASRLPDDPLGPFILRETQPLEKAYQRLADHEACRDLAAEFARRSVARAGDDAGSISFRYQSIVDELNRSRWLIGDHKWSVREAVQPTYKTQGRFKEAWSGIDVWMRRFIRCYVFPHIDQDTFGYKCPRFGWLKIDKATSKRLATLRRFPVELVSPLAKEYIRDRTTLFLFLSAVFARWRKIFAPDSLWRAHVVTLQLAARKWPRKDIVCHLEQIGAIPPTNNPMALGSRVRMYLSRSRTPFGEKSKRNRKAKTRSRNVTPRNSPSRASRRKDRACNRKAKRAV